MLKDNKPRVIVLLAACNGENFIKDQLDSLINQTLAPFKIIINVDFSSDKTLDIAQYYQKKYPEILLIKSHQFFGSAGKNFIDLLKNNLFFDSDYIALCDQDDIWKKNKLEKACHTLAMGYDAYSSNVDAFWESGQRKNIVKNQPQKNFDYFFESAGPGCTFVISKKLAISLQESLKKKNMDQFDFAHDWLIYAYARSNNYKWFIDSFASVKYRQHSSNVLGANIGLKAFILRTLKVLQGVGFDFSFKLMKNFNENDPFIKSLFPITRLNLIKLAFYSSHCRRRKRDQFFFFCACFLLAIIYPKRISNFK
jgi:rhamnosyltransferase